MAEKKKTPVVDKTASGEEAENMISSVVEEGGGDEDAEKKIASNVEKPAEEKIGVVPKETSEESAVQPSNKKKVVEKTSDVANPSEVEKTSAELSEMKVPEKKAPEKSKLPAAPSDNEPSGGSEEASESSDEEVS